MLEVSQLKRSFGAVAAVKGVSFTAKDGEITGLLGPNGAGKTTTFRMLYGILKPDAGSVTVDGIDVTHAPIKALSRMGVLPDARGLYKRLTAEENIRFYAELQGVDPTLIDGRVASLINTLGLSDIAKRRCDGFSQGERVKTAIARALVHDPQNLLLDEPTNGLDVIATRAMREFLKKERDSGRCVLLSTHLMQEVSALCDRIVIIHQGQVIAQGTPAELRQLSGKESLEDTFMTLIEETEELTHGNQSASQVTA
jgi:sodium transport system ATP-binding protein